MLAARGTHTRLVQMRKETNVCNGFYSTESVLCSVVACRCSSCCPLWHTHQGRGQQVAARRAKAAAVGAAKQQAMQRRSRSEAQATRLMLLTAGWCRWRQKMWTLGCECSSSSKTCRIEAASIMAHCGCRACCTSVASSESSAWEPNPGVVVLGFSMTARGWFGCRLQCVALPRVILNVAPLRFQVPACCTPPQPRAAVMPHGS